MLIRCTQIDVYLGSDCTSAKETLGTLKSKSSLLEPVIVFSDDMESHIADLRRVLSRLQVAGFTLLLEDTSEISNMRMRLQCHQRRQCSGHNPDCLAINVHV